MWIQLQWFFFWYSFISVGVAFQWNTPPVSPCWQQPELPTLPLTVWAGSSPPLACRVCEQSLGQEFLKHRESFVRKWEICWFLQFLLLDCQRQSPQFFWAVDPFAHGAGWAEAAMAMLSWLGAKSHGGQVGKGPALDHSTEMALRKHSCTGYMHPQPCSEHILTQTFNLLCLSIKKKAKFLLPSSFSWANVSFWRLNLVLIFQVFPVISGVLSCEEEEREQPDFLKTDQSLTWICPPNPALQWEWT